MGKAVNKKSSISRAMMNLKSTDQPMLLQEESTLPKVELTSKPYCVVKYDLQKLMMLSPLVKSIISELNIPAGLSHLLDVTIMMPGVEVEALVLLVKILGGEVANAIREEEKNILEVAEALGIELDLGKINTSNNADMIVFVKEEEDNVIQEINNIDVDSDVSILFGGETQELSEKELSLSMGLNNGEAMNDGETDTKSEIKQEPFKCKDCSATLSSSKLLIRHMVGVHTEKLKTPCDICGKIFNRKDAMKTHKKKYHASFVELK